MAAAPGRRLLTETNPGIWEKPARQEFEARIRANSLRCVPSESQSFCQWHAHHISSSQSPSFDSQSSISSSLIMKLLFSFLFMFTTLAQAAMAPISLHPDNPRYFLWRGQPTVIITSGEHYGAVLNLDFDYRRYLDTLAKDKLNGTRLWAGAYAETGGNFGIADNTLNPAAGRFISPWARSDQPGYADGGNKFDLTRWDEAFFKRLKDFVGYAAKKGIVVEVNLFCPMYEESMWSMCPMNRANNVNGLGAISRHDPLTLDKSGGLLAVQEAMVRQFAAELREFDNVTFEIVNEPYATNPPVPDDWQRHLTDVLAAAMKDWPQPFLISWNIANGSAKVMNPHPAVSFFNFHYATPPDAAAVNWNLNKPIGDNETGFRGTGDAVYRGEAWDFIIAGGALFNHLDYSFTVGHEDGTYQYPATQPGGGNPTLRRQFGILRDFIHGFDFVHMKPENSIIKGGVPTGGTSRALVAPGKAYAIYVRQAAATGQFSVRWTGLIEAPLTGELSFHTSSNDGVRFWANDQLLIDKWVDQSEIEHTGKLAVIKGQKLRVKLEYFYNGGQAAAKLAWSGPGLKKEAVPASALLLPDGSGRGMKGEYFSGNQFDAPWHSRTDAQLNFAWGTTSPFPAKAADGAVALQVELPAGHWQAEWLDTKTGKLANPVQLKGPGISTLSAPAFTDDIALRILKRQDP